MSPPSSHVCSKGACCLPFSLKISILSSSSEAAGADPRKRLSLSFSLPSNRALRADGRTDGRTEREEQQSIAKAGGYRTTIQQKSRVFGARERRRRRKAEEERGGEMAVSIQREENLEAEEGIILKCSAALNWGGSGPWVWMLF